MHGDHRGKELGFPTANIDLAYELAHPAQGVYAGRARVGDAWYAAATNVGVNPTFGGDVSQNPLRVESYLLDFSEDIYDEPIRIEFWVRLRDELKFPTVGALIEQMHADVAATKKLVGDSV